MAFQPSVATDSAGVHSSWWRQFARTGIDSAGVRKDVIRLREGTTLAPEKMSSLPWLTFRFKELL